MTHKPQVESWISTASRNQLRHLKVLAFASFKIVQTILAVLNAVLFKSLAAFNFRYEINRLLAVKRFLVLLFICFYSIAWCQVMNIRNWRKSEKDSLEHSLQLVEERKFSTALPIFERIYENHPTEDYLKYTIAKCYLSKPEKHEEAYKLLTEVFQKNKKIPDIQYYLAQAAYYNYNFDEALNTISSFALNKHISPDSKKNAENLKTLVGYAKYYNTHPNGSKVFNMGSVINSEGDESSPQLPADETQLIYNYCGSKSIGGKQNNTWQADERGSYFSDIYSSTKSEGEFSEAMAIKNINGRGPDMALSLSQDAGILFVYRYTEEGRGDIYTCDLIGNEYSKPRKLKGLVNTSFWEGSCSLSPDGKVLYFVSDRPGGRGGKDIYRASLSQDSSWISIVNLGDSVNTAQDEESPFMHADGKTLFYSSKGKTTSGGYDVFKTVMRTKDSLFKKSENLGYPINSPSDDIFFVMAANGENAYLSSNRKDGKGLFDIYHVEPHFKGAKPSLCLLKGIVNKDGKPVEAEIKVEVSTKNNLSYSKFYSNQSSGNYLTILPTGETYKLSYTLKNLEPKIVNVDLTDMAGYVEKIKNINFNSLTDSLKNKIIPEITSQKTLSSVSLNTIVPQTTNQSTTRQNTVVTATSNMTVANSKSKEVSSNNTITVTKEMVAKKKDTIQVTLNKDSEENKVKVAGNKTVVSTSTVLTKDSSKVISKTQPVAPSATISINNQKANSVKDATLSIITASADSKQKITVTNPKSVDAKSKSDSLKATGTFTSTTTKTVKKDSTVSKTSTVNSTPSAPKKVIIKDFTPRTKGHEKMLLYAQKYGMIELTDLTFKAQISAFKGKSAYEYPKLNKLGKIEEQHSADNYTRLFMGGTFKNYATAFDFVRKIIGRGHDDVYIVAIYKGERYSIEDLEAVGIFR